jgi:hypothetical protein
MAGTDQRALDAHIASLREQLAFAEQAKAASEGAGAKPLPKYLAPAPKYAAGSSAAVLQRPVLPRPAAPPPPPLPQQEEGGKGSSKGDMVLKLRGMPEKLHFYEATAERIDGGVQCKICKGWVKHWRYTRNYNTTELAKNEADEDKIVRTHLCVQCLMQEEQVPYEDAMRQILEQNTQVGKKRAANFEQAKKMIKEDLSFTGSNKQLKKISRNSGPLIELFKPVAHIIARKRAKVEMSVELYAKHDAMLTQISVFLTGGGSAKDVEPLLRQLRDLEADIEKCEAPQAFAMHPPKTQAELLTASTYFDEWQRTGNLWLRSWYVCSCGCVMASLCWRRRHDVLNSTKQRWYCRACSRRYKTSMGQLVEFSLNGTEDVCWSLATIPPPAIEDMRAMIKEEEVAPRTPAALLRAIEQHVPVTGSILRPATRGDLHDPMAPDWEESLQGMCFLKPAARVLLQQRPFFDWNAILLATEG